MILKRWVVKKSRDLEMPSLRAIAHPCMPALDKLLTSKFRAQALGLWLRILPRHPHTGHVAIIGFSPNRLMS